MICARLAASAVTHTSFSHQYSCRYTRVCKEVYFCLGRIPHSCILPIVFPSRRNCRRVTDESYKRKREREMARREETYCLSRYSKEIHCCTVFAIGWR